MRAAAAAEAEVEAEARAAVEKAVGITLQVIRTGRGRTKRGVGEPQWIIYVKGGTLMDSTAASAACYLRSCTPLLNGA